MLWERSFTPSPSPFDTLIREALIEQRSTSTTTTTGDGAVSRWDKDAHSLLWLLANDLDLVFCVAYQRILSLPYVADLLEAIRKAFLKAYRETIEAVVESTKGKDVLILGGAGGSKAAFGLFGEKGWQKVFAGWDETFNRILRDFEASAAKVRPLPLYPFPSSRLLTQRSSLCAEQEDDQIADSSYRRLAFIVARRQRSHESVQLWLTSVLQD